MMLRGSAVLALALVAGCSSGGGSGPAAPNPDGGTAPAGTITIRTRAPNARSDGGINATWAAVLDASGAWKKLEPSATVGTYTFPLGGRPTWAVAFVCADEDRSLVAVLERLGSVTALDVELEGECAPVDTNVFDLTGTFAHVPPTTSWLDFGYALTSRGFTMPAKGDSAAYEVIDVHAGTWDLGFGLRNEGGAPLTKMMIVRDQNIAAATKLDFDVAAVAFDPIPKALVVNGIAPEEQFEVTARYALNGGAGGLDIGPQDVPDGQATATLQYVTVPPAVAKPTDRHRIQALAANADKESRTATRSVDATFQAAIDATLELPPPLAVPRAERAAAEPYVRITTFVGARPNTATYEAYVVGRVSNRITHSWRLSIDGSIATGPEAILAMPDLSAAEGFDKKWAIGAGVTAEITAAAREIPAPIGDGTLVRAATRSLELMP